MKLPRLRYADGIGKNGQTQFGGLNHNPGAGDGELWDMENLTGDLWPLLSTREKRWRLTTLNRPNGLFAWDGLIWVDGDGFYYKGERKGAVEDSRKTFAALGAYVVILPDKAYFNTLTGEFGKLEARWSGNALTFTNGRLYEEDAEANTLQCAGVRWADHFRAGDAVTIEGCTVHPKNNKTPVIREIDGDKLYFYEHVFELNGEKGDQAYTETGNLTVTRKLPELKYLCENENRLWGCDDTTIYASKLGDIFNWNVFEGLATDSYAVDTGSAGAFTGCCSFLGYPVFFKEEHIYKVYGSIPSNFQVMGSATLGVAGGSGKSLAIAGETLLYLSGAGMMAYSGGIPQPIGGAFGRARYREACGGSDGLKYYVTMTDERGKSSLFVYDTQKGLWHREDERRAIGFCRDGGCTWCLFDDGGLWAVSGEPENCEAEGDVSWFAEFGDFTSGSPNKKQLEKLLVRLELDEGAHCRAEVRFDSRGDWLPAGAVMEWGETRSYVLPIVPARSDHYRVRLSGTGGCRVYSLVREEAEGSELRSTKGRS